MLFFKLAISDFDAQDYRSHCGKKDVEWPVHMAVIEVVMNYNISSDKVEPNEDIKCFHKHDDSPFPVGQCMKFLYRDLLLLVGL